MTRHFLRLSDVSAPELKALIARAIELKQARARGERPPLLRGRTLALIFEKSSTRTRVSFEAGMAELGGTSLFLAPADLQLGRGEPIEDTARVVSRMVDAITIRTHEHQGLERFAAFSQVPVINALTDAHHPCQLLADLQTFVEHRGTIEGRVVAWVGDGNNMCHSWIEAALQMRFTLRVATPARYRPDATLVARAGAAVVMAESPEEAVAGADLVVTDTWASMGQEHEKDERAHAFASYQVTTKLMARARPDALFMHCLPAYRGKEVASDVIDGPQSVVWDEAENRLHAQKALLEFLLS